ncbi:hypothetical protein T484DRAFT_1889871 [Baffinella frigidus]|nr:hypothetical protein T484DRAFT_1889871 [Cryptophyta sp. CCMP2293]
MGPISDELPAPAHMGPTESPSPVVAGLSGPIIMSLGLILWEGSWKGSALMLNAVKNTIASLIFLAIVPLRLDTWRRGLGLDLLEGDSSADVARMDMLLLSSVLGIAISDNMWLAALKILGTRRIVLVDCVKPFVSAVLSFFILGESLRIEAGGAMAVTMAGIILVSLEKRPEAPAASEKDVELVVLPGDEAVENGGGREGGGLERGGGGRDGPGCLEQPSAEMADGMTRITSNGKDDGVEAEGGRGEEAEEEVIDVYAMILVKQFGAGLGAWEIPLIRFGFAAVLCIAVLLAARLPACLPARPFWRRFSSDDAPSLLSRADGHTGGQAEEKEGAGEELGRGTGGSGPPERDRQRGTGQLGAGAGRLPEWARIPEMGPREWALVACGSVLATFLCPALSTYAVFQIDVSTLSTLSATAPISSIPLVILIKREHVPCQGMIGALVACLGVAWLSALTIPNL